MRFVVSLLLAMFALAAAPPATAPPVGPAEPDIVIEGRLKAAMTHFVELMTQTGPSDQIARWKDEVCPLVIGIDPAEADFITQRIDAVAKSLRLRAGKRDCTSSLAVIVTPDADGAAQALLKRYPITLRTDGYSRLKVFLNSTEPVRWISVTDECGGTPHGGCSLPNSRISKATRPTFAAMIVIVDARQIEGFRLGELSDYVALVALSNPPTKSRTRDDSILSMFDRPRPNGVQFELTGRDRSFLSGLYHAPLDLSGRSQRGSIARQMTREAKRQASDSAAKP